MKPPLRVSLLAVAMVAALPGQARAGIEHDELNAVAALIRLAFGQPADPPSRPQCCASCEALVDPGPTPAAWLHTGSPNQRLLARVWNYGYALRHRATSDVNGARSLVLEVLDQQDRVANPGGHYGHYATVDGDEALNSSHYQLWSAGVMGAYVIALANGGTFRAGQDPRAVGDAPVRDAARRWWLVERQLYDLLTNDGAEASIHAPGARFRQEEQVVPSTLRDSVYRLLRGQPVSRGVCWWEARADVSAWAMRELGRRAPISVLSVPDGTGPEVRLRNTLCIYRSAADYVISFPKIEAMLDPLFWVARISGNRSHAPLGYGNYPFGPTPPPALFGESVQAVPGVASQGDALLECQTAARR